MSDDNDSIYTSVQRGPGSRTYDLTKLRRLLDLPACPCADGIYCPELLLNPEPEAYEAALKTSRLRRRKAK